MHLISPYLVVFRCKYHRSLYGIQILYLELNSDEINQAPMLSNVSGRNLLIFRMENTLQLIFLGRKGFRCYITPSMHLWGFTWFLLNILISETGIWLKPLPSCKTFLKSWFENPTVIAPGARQCGRWEGFRIRKILTHSSPHLLDGRSKPAVNNLLKGVMHS